MITTIKKKLLKPKSTKIVVKKTFNGYTINIRSRHPSHRILRTNLPKMPFKSIVRLGSTTELEDGIQRIELNSVEAIKNSSSKLRMKQRFAEAGIKTTEWMAGNEQQVKNWCSSKFPIIAKGIFGSRGEANTKIDTFQQLEQFLKGKNLSGYIFEAFFDGSREYRFHVSTNGVFLTWRKLRRNDTPDNERWFFNNHNCNWVSEQHELYNRPTTYNEIAQECQKALNAVGLSIGGCDVRINKKGEFKIIEINSACSLAEQTGNAYLKEIPILLTNKYNQNKK